DELSSLFRIAKAAPGVAWRVGDSFSLGASLQVVYADIRQKVFAQTSSVDPADPSRSFFGFESRGMRGFSGGIKVGAMYRFGERVALGAAYTSRMPIHLEDGEVAA